MSIIEKLTENTDLEYNCWTDEAKEEQMKIANNIKALGKQEVRELRVELNRMNSQTYYIQKALNIIYNEEHGNADDDD